MTQPASVGVFVLVLVVAVVAIGGSGPILLTGAGSGIGADAGPDEPSGTIAAEPGAAAEPRAALDDIESDDFDSTTFDITVYENGTATWTFRYEQRLDGSDDDATREDFETFAEEFESTETDLYTLFSEQAQVMVDSGAEITDREMEATDFNRSARVEDGINALGVVEMSFTWHGFAATEDDSVVVGDVFQNLYLTDDQSMVIEAADGLDFQRTTPDGEHIEYANSVRWSGEREFFDGQPRVVLTHTEPEPSEGFVSSATDGDPTSWPVVAAGFVLVLAVGSGVAWYHRRGRDDPGDGGSPSASAAGLATGESDGGGESAAGDAMAPHAERGQSDAATDQGPHGPLTDEDLMTDEDRVVDLIRENGGRMKQVNIVEETGWSKSKVSMLLSEMEDEGTISKLRVGRENIISLDGYEPEATKSPFDEQ